MPLSFGPSRLGSSSFDPSRFGSASPAQSPLPLGTLRSGVSLSSRLPRRWLRWMCSILTSLPLWTACQPDASETPSTNRPPQLVSLAASALRLQPGDGVSLSVQALDPEGEPLTIAWEAPVGTFSAPTAAQTSWSTLEQGAFLLTCTVTDPAGESAALSLSLTVEPAPSDLDGDGWTSAAGDCNDFEAAVSPTSEEVLDGRDNDCDGLVDEGTASDDQDGDGFSAQTGDCNDSDPSVHPGVGDPPDGSDNDCDGHVDEGSSQADDDLDGFSEAQGDCDDQLADVYPDALELPDQRDNDCDGTIDDHTVLYDDDLDGYSELEGDCLDSNPLLYPGAAEQPNGLDDNCDGRIDEGTPLQDLDGDGSSLEAGDCDDDRADVYPSAPELADGTDNDCDARIDEGTSLSDDDRDGFTDAEGDCDDFRSSVYPTAQEVVDDLDNNCNGLIDEDTELYDDDVDGFSELQGDCADDDFRRNPAMPELPDALDNDCDGLTDEGTALLDVDGDGFTIEEGDCRDTDPTTYPGAVDLPDDGVNNDCSDTPANQAPLAVARLVGASAGCASLVLDASQSRDPEGSPLTQQWFLLDPPAAASAAPSLLDSTSSRAEFFWERDGIYQVGLAVSDGELTGAADLLTLDTSQLRGELCERDDDLDGYTTADGDCNDQDAAIRPDAVEVCDGVDQNCDGEERLFLEPFDRFDATLWNLYGDAVALPGEVQLTDAVRNQAGSVFYHTLLGFESFTLDFEFWLEGGSSGNGLTVVFLDPAAEQFLGTGGGGNGVLGLPGWGVEFDTNRDADYDGDVSSDHIAVIRTDDLSVSGVYPRANTRTYPMIGQVRVSSGKVQVFLNSVSVLTVTPSFPMSSEGWLGVVAATGSETDRQHLLQLSYVCP